MPPPADDGPRHPCCPANTDFPFDCLLLTDNTVDDAKRERKRKEIAGRLSREMGEHRDECVFSFLLPSVESPQYRNTLADVWCVVSVLGDIMRTA